MYLYLLEDGGAGYGWFAIPSALRDPDAYRINDNACVRNARTNSRDNGAI